jgi:hypothetical protein
VTRTIPMTHTVMVPTAPVEYAPAPAMAPATAPSGQAGSPQG